MQKYLVLYHATASAMQAMMNSTPEDMKAVMDSWLAWSQRCGDGLIEMAPLRGGQNMTSSGSSESELGIVTYAVLQAENMDAAKALLADHPHLGHAGCEIAVYETMSLPW